jgi:short-subunit dehydrogenase
VTERVTLITGASAGIGTELVRVFASNGHRVAMVARRADRLEALAAEIAAKGSSAPIIIPCDLEKPDAGDKIAAALTDLSLRFADHLVRNRGGLLNVASIASFLPGPGMAVYYASKAYVLSFTEALRGELGSSGVRVTALCPGPVPSEFQSRAGYEPGLDSAVLNVSAAKVAEDAYRGLMANKRAVLPGLGIKALPLVLRLFPRGFILAAVARFQTRQR